MLCNQEKIVYDDIRQLQGVPWNYVTAWQVISIKSNDRYWNTSAWAMESIGQPFVPLRAPWVTLRLSPQTLPACIYRLDTLNQFSMCQALPNRAKMGLSIQNIGCFRHEGRVGRSAGSLQAWGTGNMPWPDGNMWQNYRNARQWMYLCHQLCCIICTNHEPTIESFPQLHIQASEVASLKHEMKGINRVIAVFYQQSSAHEHVYRVERDWII